MLSTGFWGKVKSTLHSASDVRADSSMYVAPRCSPLLYWKSSCGSGFHSVVTEAVSPLAVHPGDDWNFAPEAMTATHDGVSTPDVLRNLANNAVTEGPSRLSTNNCATSNRAGPSVDRHCNTILFLRFDPNPRIPFSTYSLLIFRQWVL